MTRRSLLLVGLVALVIALAMTGALSILRIGEVVEVFPLPPETLDLPLPAGLAAEGGTMSPQAVAPASASTSAAVGLPGMAVQPITVTLEAGRAGYTGCSDTYIQYYLPTVNFCDSPELYVVTSNKAATLLRFDLTKLPEDITGLDSDATILEATLGLYAAQGNKGAVIGIYLPDGPWDPCAVTWDTPWGTAGADGLADRELDPRVEAAVQQDTGWVTFDVTGLVQYWLREPAQNYGIIIKSFDLSRASHYIFFSCDHPDKAVRPQLTITYEPALAVPIPTPITTPIPTETATATPASTSAETPPSATPTAAPSLTPVTTPTLILPLSPRVIELHWQNQMNVGGSYPIQIIFRPEAGAVSDSGKLYRLSVFAQVTAPTFDVVQNSPMEQVLEQPEDILSWAWQVEPKMVGSQSLSFDLLFSWKPTASTVPSIAKDTGTWYQTKVVKVVSPFRYWTPLLLLRGLLLAIAVVCLVGWYVLRRRTRDRSVDD